MSHEDNPSTSPDENGDFDVWKYLDDHPGEPLLIGFHTSEPGYPASPLDPTVVAIWEKAWKESDHYPQFDITGMARSIYGKIIDFINGSQDLD